MASIAWVQYPLSVGERVAGIPVRVRLTGVTVTDLEVDTARSSSGVSLRKEGGVVVYREIDASAGIYEVYIARSTIYDGQSYREGELPVGARNAIGITLYDTNSGARSETIYIDTQPAFASPTSGLLSEFVDDFETESTEGQPPDSSKWEVSADGEGSSDIVVLCRSSFLEVSNNGELDAYALLVGTPCSGFPVAFLRFVTPAVDEQRHMFGVAWLPDDGGAYSVSLGASQMISAIIYGDPPRCVFGIRDCGSGRSVTVDISDAIEEMEDGVASGTVGILYDGARAALIGGGRILAEHRGGIGGYASGSRWRPFLRTIAVGGETVQADRVAAYGFASPPTPAMFGAAELWQQESASEYFDPQPVGAPTSITTNNVYRLTTDGLVAKKRYLLKQIGGYRISYRLGTSTPTVTECRYGDPLPPDVPVILVPQTSGTHVYACKTVDGTSDATVFLIPLDGGSV